DLQSVLVSGLVQLFAPLLRGRCVVDVLQVEQHVEHAHANSAFVIFDFDLRANVDPGFDECVQDGLVSGAVALHYAGVEVFPDQAADSARSSVRRSVSASAAIAYSAHALSQKMRADLGVHLLHVHFVRDLLVLATAMSATTVSGAAFFFDLMCPSGSCQLTIR